MTVYLIKSLQTIPCIHHVYIWHIYIMYSIYGIYTWCIYKAHANHVYIWHIYAMYIYGIYTWCIFGSGRPRTQLNARLASQALPRPCSAAGHQRQLRALQWCDCLLVGLARTIYIRCTYGIFSEGGHWGPKWVYYLHAPRAGGPNWQVSSSALICRISEQLSLKPAS